MPNEELERKLRATLESMLDSIEEYLPILSSGESIEIFVEDNEVSLGIPAQ